MAHGELPHYGMDDAVGAPPFHFRETGMNEMCKRSIIEHLAKDYLFTTAKEGRPRREAEERTMKTVFFAAAALSLGMSAAFANEGGPNPSSSFTQLPGVIAQAPLQKVPSIDTTQRGQVDRGPWLFPPIGKYLDQPAGG